MLKWKPNDQGILTVDTNNYAPLEVKSSIRNKYEQIPYIKPKVLYKLLGIPIAADGNQKDIIQQMLKKM